MTVQIVTLLIGDSEFDNPKTLAAFALGLVLFIITLFLNLIALRVVRKYREVYDVELRHHSPPGLEIPEMAARRRKRYAADRRLRLAGLAAITFAIGFLVILVASLLNTGASASVQNQGARFH